MEIFSGVGLGLLWLTCPIGMIAMMGIPWLLARARGEKRPLAMHCMPGHEAAHRDEEAGSAEPARFSH